jgi:hypothetical protein
MTAGEGQQQTNRPTGRNEYPASLKAQPTTSTKSIQAPNVDISSLNDTFTSGAVGHAS